MAGARKRRKPGHTTHTDGPRFILPSSFPFFCTDPQSFPHHANPRCNAPEEQKGDHFDLLPETGAKRPFNGAFAAFLDCGGAGVVKLTDALLLLSPRAANNWLCVQDTRTGCTGAAMATTVAALAVCS